MRRKTARRKAVALALALVLTFGFVSLVGVPRVVVAHPVAVVSSATVNVSSPGFTFVPNLIEQVSPNVSIRLNFDDTSPGTAHTFTIYKREGVVIGQNPNSPASAVPGLLYGAGPYNGNLANDNASGSGWFNTTFPAPAKGWYEFVCTQSGHFQAGMYGFIAFGENLPANLSVTVPDMGAGAAVFIIVATIVTLTMIAIVLGFVVGRRRGSEFEMPPERLGYQEPLAPGASPPAPPSPPSAPSG